MFDQTFFFFFKLRAIFRSSIVSASSIAKLNFLLIEKNKLQQVSTFTFSNSTFFFLLRPNIHKTEKERESALGEIGEEKKMGRLFFCISIPKRSIDLLAVESLVFEPFHTNKSRGKRQTFLRGCLIPRYSTFGNRSMVCTDTG